jgi:hypothetical protein
MGTQAQAYARLDEALVIELVRRGCALALADVQVAKEQEKVARKEAKVAQAGEREDIEWVEVAGNPHLYVSVRGDAVVWERLCTGLKSRGLHAWSNAGVPTPFSKLAKGHERAGGRMYGRVGIDSPALRDAVMEEYYAA